MEIGRRVRIRPSGASVFVIVDLDDAGRTVIESVGDEPGKYRFSMPIEDLMPE